MRSISSTLLQAATSLRGRPTVRVTVEDRQVRWRRLHTPAPTVDLPCVGAMSSGSIILRAGVDASGNLYHQEIADPASLSAWRTWTLLAAGASRAAGDVAVAWYNLTWLVYYQDGDRYIHLVASDDDGDTWSAPLTVYRPGRTAALAACGRYLFVLESALRCYHLDAGMATWSGPYTLAGLAPESDQGIAAAIQPTEGGGQMVRLMLSMGGGIRAVSYNPATQTYGDVRAITPGRDQALPAAAAHRWPSLYALDGETAIATWVERWTGDLDAWRHPVSRLARDADAQHWGMEVSLADPAVTDRRLALCYDSLDEVLYASNGELVLAAEMWDPLLNPLSRLGPRDALAYRAACRPHAPGRLRVTLLDEDGRLATPGQAGAEGQALQPLSRVTVSRGYITAEGREEADLATHWIASVTRSEGLGGGRVEIDAVDAFGLLEMWRPPEPLAWDDRPLRYLAREVCAQVGLTFFDDGGEALGDVLEDFNWGPETTALEALQALLRLAGCVARPQGSGVYALSLASYEPADVGEIGAAGEVLRARYGMALPEATAVRVVGDDVWSDGDDVAAAQALGLRRHRYVEDTRVDSQGRADAVRDRELLLAQMTAQRDGAAIPLRPDLEAWDVVEVAGLGARIITGLVETWDGRRYETEVELGKWGGEGG